MKRTFYTFLLIFLTSTIHANESCQSWPKWFQSTCKRLDQIIHEGDSDLYISGYAWHNRATYSREKIDSYNEFAAGGGYGKGLYDNRGNWNGLFAIAFLDSHKNVEPAVGYAYLFTAHLNNDLKFGVGPALFITARPDIFNNIPFPALLPWAAVTYKRASISATYIPGAQGAGNVLFIVGKWRISS